MANSSSSKLGLELEWLTLPALSSKLTKNLTKNKRVNRLKKSSQRLLKKTFRLSNKLVHHSLRLPFMMQSRRETKVMRMKKCHPILTSPTRITKNPARKRREVRKVARKIWQAYQERPSSASSRRSSTSSANKSSTTS